MNTPTELLGSKAAMNHPLMKPGGFQRGLAGTPQPTANVRSAEGCEARLHLSELVRIGLAQIRIDVKDCVRTLVEQDQSRVVERLIKEVVMNPFGQRSAVV